MYVHTTHVSSNIPSGLDCKIIGLQHTGLFVVCYFSFGVDDIFSETEFEMTRVIASVVRYNPGVVTKWIHNIVGLNFGYVENLVVVQDVFADNYFSWI